MEQNKQRNIYLTSQQIYDEWKRWKESAEREEDRQPTEQMGKYMLLLCDRMLTNPRFRAYPEWLKDEMKQEGCLKILRNLKNMREDKKGSFFSYWTITAWTAYIVVLGKYYEEKNQRRQLLVNALRDAKHDNIGALDESFIRQLEAEIKLYNINENEIEEED